MNVDDSENVERVRRQFARAFVDQTGISEAWLPDVVENVRLRVADSSIRLVFRGATASLRREDGKAIAESVLGTLPAILDHWRGAGHARGPDPWDVAPGEHAAAGCQCETIDDLDGKAAVAYISSHLHVVKGQGDDTAGFELVFCPFTGQRWMHRWEAGTRSLTRLDDDSSS